MGNHSLIRMLSGSSPSTFCCEIFSSANHFSFFQNHCCNTACSDQAQSAKTFSAKTFCMRNFFLFSRKEASTRHVVSSHVVHSHVRGLLFGQLCSQRCR